jgi:hypothetical protein
LSFEYVDLHNFAYTSDTNSGAYVSFTNGHANFTRCIFYRPYQQWAVPIFEMSASSVILDECICNVQVTSATTIGTAMPLRETASYDPMVPISVCRVPPGTTHFTPSNAPAASRAFPVSAGWNRTAEVAISAPPAVSQAPLESQLFIASEVIVATRDLRNSEAVAASSDLEPSAGVANSAALAKSRDLAVARPPRETGGQNESRHLQDSADFGGTNVFSASAQFTGWKCRYKHGRSLMKLSGYTFFVFFAGDRQ